MAKSQPDQSLSKTELWDGRILIPGPSLPGLFSEMSNTSNLQLPYLAVGQAQKHVTVNESLRRLDAIVQLSVVSSTTDAQPGAPGDGAVYIIPAGKSGADWAGFANWSLAYYRDGAWEQITPRAGWLAFVADTGLLLHHTGAGWEQFAPARLLALSETDRLIGRASAGGGAAEEIVCTGAGRALIDDGEAGEQCATLGAWRVVAASAVGVSHSGDTSETALATIAIPAGRMGPNGALRVTSHWSFTNSANAKTVRLRLGGIGGASFLASTHTSASGGAYQRTIQNRNSEASQIAYQHNNGNSFSTGTMTTGAVDTSEAQDLVLTATLANAGETITLESVLVELYHGA